MTEPEKTFTQSRWILDDLLSGDPLQEVDKYFVELEQKAAEFETLRGSLQDDISVEAFQEAVNQIEAIERLVTKVFCFAQLWFSQDTQNPAAQNLLARCDQFGAGLSNRMLFFSLWWKALPETSAERLMQPAGDLRYWLEEMRHFKDFTLSEPEEKIINLKNVTGTGALNLMYDSITNRYQFKLKVDGKQRKLTRGELMIYARSTDADLRQAAYRELYRVYGQDGDLLGQLYQALARDWYNENLSLRKFSSPIAVRNLSNDLPDAVVDTLLDVVRQNRGIFQRFFRLKAKYLKVDRLRRCDIYAPLSHAEKHFTFDQASSLVLDSFRRFDPRMAELAQRVFDQQHLDSEVRKGKRSGAFCLTALPEIIPWVLVNYQGKAEDAATLAHELGHAVHSMLASHHSLFTHHACLPLAETASTFGEMMLVDRMLEEENNPEVRRDLIVTQVDNAYATITRQAYFCLFERQAHQMVQEGAPVDAMCAAYLENLREQFGDAVDVPDEFGWEWVSIPHIYSTPFYVYAYSFGQLLVLSLYKQYRLEGESFKPRYIKLLSAGGSLAPMQILEEAGIDPRQPSFWQGGLDVIDGLVKQLEGM